MDINEDNYESHLEAYKKRFQTEKDFQATALEFPDDEEIVSRWSSIKVGKVKQVVVAVGEEESLVCGKSVDELKRVELEDLSFFHPNLNSYLLCRILPRPAALSTPLNPTIKLLISSPSSSSILLELHNYPLLPASLGRPTSGDIDVVFPPGAFLLIKEPKLRLLDGKSGEMLLKVDGPADIVKVERESKMLEGVEWKTKGKGKDGAADWKLPDEAQYTLEEWKDQGNQSFSSRRFLSAVIAYSTGIQQHPSHLQLHLLLLNRSQTFIKLERFSFALADAEHALSLIESIPTSSTSSSSNGIDPLSPTLSAADVIALKEKALSRKAKALYSLRRWQLALEVYRQLLSISPHLSDAQTGISSCQSRLSEASGGSCFDFPSLYRLSLQQHHSKEGGTAKMGDVADYVGPVKVAPIEGKGGGRGLVATREIQPGEILLAVRAPALVSQSEIPKRLSPRLVSLNLEEDVLDETHLPLYIHNLIYRLLDQPELIPKINDLYTGPRSSCTSPTFDLYTPDHPSSSFASSNPNLSTPPSSSSLPPIRPSDLYRAAFYNASTPSCSLPIDSLSSDAIEYYEEAPGALFSESAMINSECRRNCIHMFYGDLQITKSLALIPSGAEILASYVPDLPYSFRQTRLRKFLGVDCTCPLCQADVADPGLNRRPLLVIKAMKATSLDEDARSHVLHQLKEHHQSSSSSSKPSPDSPRHPTFDSLTPSLDAALKLVNERETVLAELQSTYSSSRTEPSPDRFFAYKALRYPLRLVYEKRPMGKKGKSRGKEKARDLERCLANEINALQSIGAKVKGRYGVVVGSGENEGHLEEKEGKITSLEDLPLSSPPTYLFPDASKICLLIASLLRLRKGGDEGGHAKSWVKQAIWLEDVTTGGGEVLFKDRFDGLLKELELVDVLD